MEKPDVKDAISRIRELPTLPSVLGQILTVVADPDASALDLGRHIAADQSLSATILKLVNSAYYGFYRQIKSVTMAIVILGFVEVRNLVLAATTFRIIADSQHSRFDRTQLWRHSLATATAAERCANKLGLNLDEAFVCGLLHDIGKVAFDTLYPEEFRLAAERAHDDGLFIRETELDIFGLDHAEVGGLLAEHWNLPPSVVEAIRMHHRLDENVQQSKLTNLATLADFVTYQADLGESSNGRPPILPEMALLSLGATEEEWRAVAEDLRQNRKRIDDILGALSS